MEQKRKEREVVTAIAKLGASFSYNSEHLGEPPGPGWLKGLFGESFFGEVVCVQLPGQPKTGDADLVCLSQLPDLQELNADGTSISDAGLSEIKGLTQLKILRLDGTKVTDTGLVSPRELD